MTLDITLPLLWVCFLVGYWCGRRKALCRCSRLVQTQVHLVRSVEMGVVRKVREVEPGRN